MTAQSRDGRGARVTSKSYMEIRPRERVGVPEWGQFGLVRIGLTLFLAPLRNAWSQYQAEDPPVCHS